MKRLLLFLLIIDFSMTPAAMAQDEDENSCNIEFLTEDFLHHFREETGAPGSLPLLAMENRLSLFFEYMSFLLICRQEQEPPSCDALNAIYADPIAEAETLDDLAILSANLTLDIIVCREVDPLAVVFEEMGFVCDVFYMDDTFADVECAGENSLAEAQALYDVALADRTLEQFIVTLNDGETETRYIYTGEEWLVEEHGSP